MLKKPAKAINFYAGIPLTGLTPICSIGEYLQNAVVLDAVTYQDIVKGLRG